MKKTTLLKLLIGLTLSACTNMSELKNRGTNTMVNPAFSSSTNSYTHTVQNVNLTALTTGSPPDLKLSLSVTSGGLALTQFCTTGSSSAKPCACVLTWTELNTVGGVATSLSRTKKLTLTDVQSGLVKCQMTQAFWNEITTGTSIRMNIEGVYPNTAGLNVQSIGYKKGTSIAPAGDFVDDTLTPFRNIYRYTCFSKRMAAYEVNNEFTQASLTSGSVTNTVNVMIGSSFCVDGSSNCQTPRNGYSAQSYYRNLFIRSDKLGEINSTNSRYDCPKVFESITHSATNVPGDETPPSEQSKYWPLDSTFAVATAATSEWSVPIPAASFLLKNDGTPLYEAGIAEKDRLEEINGSNAGIAWKMMGYGKKPNADGTCSSIVDTNGRIRPLTRLRRYRVIYPSFFKNNGQVETERPEADQVYVADRLVADVSGHLTGNMIYGPKPCNFAWFDHEGVTNRSGTGGVNENFQTNFKNSIPTYKATSKYYYENYQSLGVDLSVNPDGRVLPNIDRQGSLSGLIGPSCSASIAVYDDIGGTPSVARLLTSYYGRTDSVKIGTRDFYLGEIHLTPTDRWSPDYVEDTAFQACVPISDSYVEPPLYFYKNASDQVAWCSKVYPTQNPYWLELNSKKKPVGATIGYKAVNWGAITPGYTNKALVSWYTSHVDSGVGLDFYLSGTQCTSTPVEKICEWSLGTAAGADYAGCLTYLGANLSATGSSDNRCDRTVMFDVNQDYRGFPLQAGDADIQEMLISDLAKEKSYSCTYSVHSNTSKINKDQPMTNCCGVISGDPLLDQLPASNAANQGHLEPYMNPAYPNIRFCGNPVE
jgi:hypothetical protein